MKRKALITGVTGFVGPYMARELLAEGYEVYGIARVRSDTGRLNGLDIKIITGDVTDFAGVCAIIEDLMPDYIFNLAAQSFVPASWADPYATINTNTLGTLNVLEAVKGHLPNTVVQCCGSSEEYGLVKPEEVPIKESNPLRPLSPYAVSKVTCDNLGHQYAHSYRLKTLRTRAFNHSGVGRGPHFVETTIARQAVEMKAGLRKTFYLGNIDAVRDFSDVRDTVRAYRLLMEAVARGDIPTGSVFNICSGRGWKIRDLVHVVAEIAGVEPVIEHDPGKMRPSDVPLLVGSNEEIVRSVAWKPEYDLRQTLAEMVEWQERVLKTAG